MNADINAGIVQHVALSAKQWMSPARSTARLTADGGHVQAAAGVLVAGSLAGAVYFNKNEEVDKIEEAKRWAATPRM